MTSATLRSLNSFSRLQEMSGLKEKAGDRFVALDSPFNHVEQGKIIIPQMRYEPLMDNEEQHIAEMAAYFRQQVESKKHLGMLVLFASGRATGWWSCIANGWKAESAACWWVCSPLPKVSI